MIVGRMPQHAASFAREFAPLDAQALMSIPKHEVVARLSIDSVTSRPFSIRTDALPDPTDPTIARDVTEASRMRYGRPVTEIDAALLQIIKPQPQPIPASPTLGVGRKQRTP